MQSRMTRRTFGQRATLSGIAGILGVGLRGMQAQGPAVTTGGRPGIPNGIASGDVTTDSAVIWSRTDRAARMVVEWDTTESFGNLRRQLGPVTGAEADFTGKLRLEGLPSGQKVFYRVRFEDRQGVAGGHRDGVAGDAVDGDGPGAVCVVRGYLWSGVGHRREPGWDEDV